MRTCIASTVADRRSPLRFPVFVDMCVLCITVSWCVLHAAHHLPAGVKIESGASTAVGYGEEQEEPRSAAAIEYFNRSTAWGAEMGW